MRRPNSLTHARARAAALAALLILAIPGTAHAAPGLGDEVYGATIEQGEVEAEARYGRLAGGADSGEDALKLELAYAPTSRLRLGTQIEFEREAGQSRKAEAMGFEAIYSLGKVAGIDVAIYGEYEAVFHGPDALEGKLLLEKRAGPFDARLNLIGNKPLKGGEKLALSYAASADLAVGEDWRLGMAAFGDLGDFDNFAPRAEHFAGPVVKTEIEGLGPELGIEFGYLFALGAARDDSKGQLRLNLEMEF
ncbi:hypothetical protein [Novosphingobium lentum]|uniref:hypothetical protein n=1 Tax=Novosphingobium lentum TaxID=145287 RepID=UPI000834FD35|nr:hypothetical protein [Novosphingobium lentum]